MRVLITGGAGFIGSNLALRLTRDGHIVTVLDTLSPQIHGETPETSSPLFASIRDKVRFVRGSVCDESAMADCLEGQEAVVHLAAETGTGQSMYEIRRYADVNVGGTAVLLSAIFLALALRVGFNTETDQAAMKPERRLFAFSIVYLFLVFGLIVADKLVLR